MTLEHLPLPVQHLAVAWTETLLNIWKSEAYSLGTYRSGIDAEIRAGQQKNNSTERC